MESPTVLQCLLHHAGLASANLQRAVQQHHPELIETVREAGTAQQRDVVPGQLAADAAAVACMQCE